jgi:GPH family glycoside/pentoside/hexuronide:cation symporter
MHVGGGQEELVDGKCLVPKSKVAPMTKIQWAIGGLGSYFIMNAIFVLALPIYQVAMKIDPIKLGILMAIPRFLDLILDPLIGHLSDNANTRWGRRKPFILIGGLTCALFMPLLWMPPFSGQNMNVAYLLVIMTIYTIGYTLFLVPLNALGYELTEDYDERTRVWAAQMYVGAIGMLTMPWVYKLCFLPIFGNNEVNGAIVVSVFLGLIVIFCMSCALRCRESCAIQNREVIHFGKALKYTLQNKAFMILMSVKLIITIGIASIGFIGLYINIYYVCGSKEFTATISGLTGSLCGITSYLSISAITWLSTRTSKRLALVISLFIALLGNFSFLFTLTPKQPYLQIVSAVVANMGMMGCWLMIFSMVADICDEDEMKTGLRREGFYSAGSAFIDKVSFTIATALAGLVLTLSGYNSYTAESQGVPFDVIMRMKWLFVGSQCAGILIGMLGCFLYPITRTHAEQNRKILDERKLCRDSSM